MKNLLKLSILFFAFGCRLWAEEFVWSFDVPPNGVTNIRYKFRYDVATPTLIYVKVEGNMTYTGSSFVDVTPNSPPGYSPTSRRFSWTHPSVGPFTTPEASFVIPTGATSGTWSMNGIPTVQTVSYEADYYWDGVLPANNTGNPIVYKFYQGSTLITSVTVPNGSGSQTVHLNNLESGVLVTVIAETGGYVMSTGIPPVPVWTPNQQQEVVGGGMPTADAEPPDPTPILPPVNGTNSGTGGTAPIKPAPVTPPTPPTAPAAPTPTSPPAAPTPVAPKTAPTPRSDPNPTPSGIGGLTKADFELGINQLVQDENESRAEATANANKILEAVNAAALSENESSKKIINAIDANTVKNKESTDALRTAVTNFSTANVTALNNVAQINSTGFGRVESGLYTIRDGINVSNAHLDEISTKLDTLNGTPPTTEATQALLDAMVATATTKGAEAEALINARPTPSFTVEAEVTTPPASMFAWTLMGREINIDPVLRWPWLFQFIKALLAWCIAMAFMWWVWGKLSEMMLEITHPHGGPWNHQAITGGVPPLLGLGISAFLTGVLMALVLAVPVAFFALLDSGAFVAQLSFASADPRTLITGPSDITDAILYLLGACFPVTTGLVVLLEMFVITKGKTIIVSGLRVFQKAIPL